MIYSDAKGIRSRKARIQQHHTRSADHERFLAATLERKAANERRQREYMRKQKSTQQAVEA